VVKAISYILKEKGKNRAVSRTVLRIIDANLNRSSEGLRVCEDIARFVMRDRGLQGGLKNIRHSIKRINQRIYSKFDFVEARAVDKDEGKGTNESDLERMSIGDVFKANSQRVKEALRSLEEFTKLIDNRISEDVKKIRFRYYDAEKRAFKKIEAMRDL